MNADLTILDREPGQFAFATWQNTILISWHATPSGEAVRRLTSATESFVRLQPRGHSSIHIAPEGLAAPGSEARRGFTALLDRDTPKLACLGVILKGQGFWVSAIQSVVTGIRMLSARHYAFRFHSSIEEAAAWLPALHVERTQVVLPPRELERALQRTACAHEGLERGLAV